jgi:hypothetical protein
MGASKKNVFSQAWNFNKELFTNVATVNARGLGDQLENTFKPPKDRSDELQAQEMAQMKADQAADAARLKQDILQQPKKIQSDNSLPNRLRRQMSMRMGMQNTMTGAGSLVAPTQLNTRLGQ